MVFYRLEMIKAAMSKLSPRSVGLHVVIYFVHLAEECSYALAAASTHVLVFQKSVLLSVPTLTDSTTTLTDSITLSSQYIAPADSTPRSLTVHHCHRQYHTLTDSTTLSSTVVYFYSGVIFVYMEHEP
uniref:Uncharacterized protein n=1 Tax=Arion vulgaris TaxID=1028688 RepID=A0A0B6YAD6_9EUPU